MKEKWIWFDMDGTISNLYGVDNWLDDLLSFKVRPYVMADLMYNAFDLIRVLSELKFKGYKLGIISWSSKAHNVDYDKAVTRAKKKWLRDKMLDFLFDEIIVTPYGVNKADTCSWYGQGILVDDEETNRDNWYLGDTINANNDIIKALWALVG